MYFTTICVRHFGIIQHNVTGNEWYSMIYIRLPPGCTVVLIQCEDTTHIMSFDMTKFNVHDLVFPVVILHSVQCGNMCVMRYEVTQFIVI